MTSSIDEHVLFCESDLNSVNRRWCFQLFSASELTTTSLSLLNTTCSGFSIILFSDGEALKLRPPSCWSYIMLMEQHGLCSLSLSLLYKNNNTLLYNWDGLITLIKQTFYLSPTSSHAFSRWNEIISTVDNWFLVLIQIMSNSSFLSKSLWLDSVKDRQRVRRHFTL